MCLTLRSMADGTRRGERRRGRRADGAVVGRGVFSYSFAIIVDLI